MASRPTPHRANQSCAAKVKQQVIQIVGRNVLPEGNVGGWYRALPKMLSQVGKGAQTVFPASRDFHHRFDKQNHEPQCGWFCLLQKHIRGVLFMILHILD